MTRRGRIALLASAALLVVFPALVGPYALSLGTLILYLAFTGQAWNLMMGFAGQLSLGHALYVGLGAYAAAGLYTHYGILPWLGVWVAVASAVGMALVLGGLAFRFGVSGVHFALLTIAFAEFTRIAFDHIEFFGGPAGLFLPVSERTHWDLPALRGPPPLYYYALLVLCAAQLWFSARLVRGRAGYYWRAIREDEAAAQALGIDTFRWKLYAVMLSAGSCAVAGVFLAFYQNNLFPEQVFGMSRSIEILLGPVVGGVGSLLGPVIGSAVSTLLSDGATELLARLGWELPGTKQVLYGVSLLVVVVFLPHGIWPPLARRLGLVA
jgi:branched-chain amino acid transport system permease protein